MPAAPSLIHSVTGRPVHPADILLAVHGVSTAHPPATAAAPGLVGESRLLHAGAGRPVPSTVHFRVGETHLAHLLQQRPVPVTGWTGQLQQLGADGGDVCCPAGCLPAPEQGRIIGPDQIVRGIQVAGSPPPQPTVSLSGQRPNFCVHCVPVRHEQIGPVIPEEHHDGRLALPQGVLSDPRA